MADDELDELYGVKPEAFTALRTRLVEAAKQRGDAAAAKRISAARKPTTAAWVVNQLAHDNPEAKRRLADLGERLRAAHASMDGERIRALSTEQRHLVNSLARAAFEASALPNPSAALRDDVTGTLQAAIADPALMSQLGRLSKAERWSGFGDFGETAPVSTVARGAKAKEGSKQQPATDEPRDDDLDAKQHSQARAALAAAERAKAAADDAVSDRQADLAVARLRHDDASRRLEEAESNLRAAEDAYETVKQASRDGAEQVKEAKARLKKYTR